MNKAILPFLKQCDIRSVIDAGASDGRFSKALWPHFPKAEYILIDPIKYPDKWEGHGILWVHRCLHSGKRETIPFSIEADPFQSGAYDRGEPVDTVSLEELVEKRDGVFLKLDTHGVELDILEDSLHKLRDKIPAVQIEVYNFPLSEKSPRFHAVCRFMENSGYRVATMFDPLFRGDGCFWQMDLLFLHKGAQCFKRSDFFYS